MKTIVSLGQKGGAGKTTLLLAIASAAHEQGLNVVIADLDPESSNASMWHQRRQAFTEAKLPYVVASNSSNIETLKATLEKYANLNDEQIGGEFKEYLVTGLILTIGFLETLGVDRVTTSTSSQAHGALMYPKFWKISSK